MNTFHHLLNDPQRKYPLGAAYSQNTQTHTRMWTYTHIAYLMYAPTYMLAHMQHYKCFNAVYCHSSEKTTKPEALQERTILANRHKTLKCSAPRTEHAHILLYENKTQGCQKYSFFCHSLRCRSVRNWT